MLCYPITITEASAIVDRLYIGPALNVEPIEVKRCKLTVFSELQGLSHQVTVSVGKAKVPKGKDAIDVVIINSVPAVYHKQLFNIDSFQYEPYRAQ